tara:strand:- start:102 stop:569 length:468 start_codon:yes stop_codon:yes gene_type:complete
MSKIIFNYEGTISIMHPTPEALQIMTIEQIAEKDLPVGVTTYSIVEDSVIPTDRSFRDSWVGVGIGSTGGTITEDMTKARELHKAKIREARADKFTALDIEYQRATETSADTSAIVAKKQALRDAPAASGISTASNTTELKAQWDTSILGTSPYS